MIWHLHHLANFTAVRLRDANRSFLEELIRAAHVSYVGTRAATEKYANHVERLIAPLLIHEDARERTVRRLDRV